MVLCQGFVRPWVDSLCGRVMESGKEPPDHEVPPACLGCSCLFCSTVPIQRLQDGAAGCGSVLLRVCRLAVLEFEIMPKQLSGAVDHHQAVEMD